MISLILKIIGTIGLGALCGWMFRLGGAESAHARFLRMLGVEITEFLGLIIWFVLGCVFPIIAHFLWFTFNVSLGWTILAIFLTTALAWTECTYFKKKGTSAKWYHWLLCGIQYALIPLPLVFLGLIAWKGFLIRFLVLVPIITLWRTLQGDVDWSEGGAGAWQIVTLPLLLIK